LKGARNGDPLLLAPAIMRARDAPMAEADLLQKRHARSLRSRSGFPA
jgi:hypothetical protein